MLSYSVFFLCFVTIQVHCKYRNTLRIQLLNSPSWLAFNLHTEMMQTHQQHSWYFDKGRDNIFTDLYSTILEETRLIQGIDCFSHVHSVKTSQDCVLIKMSLYQDWHVTILHFEIRLRKRVIKTCNDEVIDFWNEREFQFQTVQQFVFLTLILDIPN